MKKIRQAVTAALSQAPPLALAWTIHGALIFYLFFAFVPADQVAAGQRLLVGVGLVCLLLAEIGLLVLANVVVELATASIKRKRPIDGAKALLASGLIGLLAASVLKYSATSVHLKKTDLWFAWNNFRQLLAEVTLADIVGLLIVPVGIVLLAAGLFVGLHRFRRRAVSPSLVRTVVPLVVAAAAFITLYRVSPGLGIFADSFVPEVHWARAGLSRSPLIATPGQAAADGDGEPIRVYRPGVAYQPYNVVLVMLESIPWKRIAAGGGRAGVTPHLDRLAAESVVFERAYTTSTHSDYAQMAILSSLHPRKFDRHDYYGRIEYPRTLLWDALAAAGYQATMFSCQNERWGNMLNYLDTPGLDVLRHSLSWPRAPRRGRGAEAKVYEETPVADWEAWRSGHPDEPFFTYFNFQANHFPYEVPPEAARPYTPFEMDFPASFLRYPRDKVPVMLNRFHNALAYADRSLGRIIESLETNGEWERTVLIVVSDHGEAFYEHRMPTHGTSLLEEQLRSVWVMRVPREAPRAVIEPVSLLDLAPTLLTVLGLPEHGNFQGRSDVLDPGYRADGRPLFATIQGLTLEDAVLVDDWKYIVNWDRRTRRLFDLGEDPGETIDLVESESARALALDERLRGFLSRQLGYYGRRGWEEGRYPPRLP